MNNTGLATLRGGIVKELVLKGHPSLHLHLVIEHPRDEQPVEVDVYPCVDPNIWMGDGRVGLALGLMFAMPNTQSLGATQILPDTELEGEW